MQFYIHIDQFYIGKIIYISYMANEVLSPNYVCKLNQSPYAKHKMCQNKASGTQLLYKLMAFTMLLSFTLFPCD